MTDEKDVTFGQGVRKVARQVHDLDSAKNALQKLGIETGGTNNLKILAAFVQTVDSDEITPITIEQLMRMDLIYTNARYDAGYSIWSKSDPKYVPLLREAGDVISGYERQRLMEVTPDGPKLVGSYPVSNHYGFIQAGIGKGQRISHAEAQQHVLIAMGLDPKKEYEIHLMGNPQFLEKNQGLIQELA